MPIYEYECPLCGKFEAIQKFSDKPLKCKPDCEESKCPKKAERLISASAFHLKGGGWYKTDYGSSGSSAPSKTAKSDDKSLSSEKSEKSEKSDSKESSSTAKKEATSETNSKAGACGCSKAGCKK